MSSARIACVLLVTQHYTDFQGALLYDIAARQE